MIKRITALFFFTIALIFFLTSLSCAGPVNNYELSAKLSEKAFYSKPDIIIKEFVKKTDNCQNNYILAGAYKDKKELKKALLYYTNSCFNNKFNFNIRLFADPVYLFTESTKNRSIFYRDSVYEIAAIFQKYREHEYVIKFTTLIEYDQSALYRDSELLKAVSLQKLNRHKDAIDVLKNIAALYKDKNSQGLIHLRLGSAYESAGEYQQANESYFDVIKSESDTWQNSIAAKRILYLTSGKKIKFDSVNRQILLASALYDADDYKGALKLAEAVIQKNNSVDADNLILKILTRKNLPGSIKFLKERKQKPEYNKLLLEHANILWETGNKNEAVKSYKKLISISDKTISERVLTRLSFFYEGKEKPEFIKYMEMYITGFPEEIQSGRFIWLIARFYIKKSEREKAIEYLNKGIQKYPDNIYTPYCRFWLNKINPPVVKNINNIKLLEELIVNNPGSYHTLSLLKENADKQDTSYLSKKFDEAVENRNKNGMQLFHSLLFIKNGYDSPFTLRLKKFDSDFTDQYKLLADLLKKPSYKSSYRSLLERIETYFYAGDTNSINREINIIPENDIKAQNDLALALTVYSLKHKNYNYSTLYGFRLLNLMNIKENLPFIPREFAEVLFPYAFSDCVNKESRKYSVKPELILSMMKVESNFNHRAISPAGATGLMQLMPGTAKDISKKLGSSKFELSDPCTSISFGTNYIAWLDRYYEGRIEYMIAAYNGGAGNINRWIKKPLNNDIDYFSEFTPFDETRDYIFRTKKYLIQYESIYKKPVKK